MCRYYYVRSIIRLATEEINHFQKYGNKGPLHGWGKLPPVMKNSAC